MYCMRTQIESWQWTFNSTRISRWWVDRWWNGKILILWMSLTHFGKLLTSRRYWATCVYLHIRRRFTGYSWDVSSSFKRNPFIYSCYWNAFHSFIIYFYSRDFAHIIVVHMAQMLSTDYRLHSLCDYSATAIRDNVFECRMAPFYFLPLLSGILWINREYFRTFFCLIHAVDLICTEVVLLSVDL